MRLIMGLAVLLWSALALAEVPVHADRNEAEYNFQYAVALDGYDPVSYFPEGGGAPQLGDANVTFTYGTIVYRFASIENRDQFKTNPLKYEPTYGSWCAYGMSHNAKIKIQPKVFTIRGNRAHFFVSKSAKKSFDDEIETAEPTADDFWKDYSGEEPRN